jgi:hypothetical protein
MTTFPDAGPRTASRPSEPAPPHRLQVDTETATRARDTVGAVAALAAGIASFAIGVTQALYPQDTDPAIDPRTRVILVAFTLVLWALVPVHLRLAARARSRWGAWVAGVGTPLLSVGTITSAARGLDLAIFPTIAVVANALWFVGSIALAVSLWRARRVSPLLPVGLVLMVPFSLFLSQMGGAVVPGVWLVVVGLLLLGGGSTGTLAPRAEGGSRPRADPRRPRPPRRPGPPRGPLLTVTLRSSFVAVTPARSGGRCSSPAAPPRGPPRR